MQVIQNFILMLVKLSKRLKKIDDMITSEYTHIWDCCCDHGLLGASLLSRRAGEHIHFVDIVPELMSQLESKLEKFYPRSTWNDTWNTHCSDVSKLPLDKYTGKHLIIIAGVGGDLMIEFIDAIYKQHKALNIDFLLCPVHHQFSLRQKLIELDFGLINDVLVEENKRFYEMIYVSSEKELNQEVSIVGNNIWKYETEQQAKIVRKYLHKTLSHYQRIQQGNTQNVQHIIDAYNAIKISPLFHTNIQ